MEILWLILLGIGTGIFGGYLGVGGATILTPILLEMYSARGISDEIRFQLVFGTTLLAILGTSIASAISYSRVKLVNWHAVKFTGIAALVATIGGSYLAAASPPSYLKTFFALFCLFNAIMLMLPPRRSISDGHEHNIRLISVGIIAGICSAYLGVAGGVVMVPLFMLWVGLSGAESPGTSSAIGIITCIAGVIGYVYHGWGHPLLPEGATGFVLPAIGIPIMIGTLAGAPIGSYLNRRFGVKAFRFVMVIFLLAIALKIYFAP